MAELTRGLEAAFRVRFGATSEADAAVRSNRDGREDEIAAQQWVRAIHTAFYAPTVRGQSGNKFLELETSLTQVLQTLSLEQHAPAGFAQFMVCVVLLLCHAPAPPEDASVTCRAAGGDDTDKLVGATSPQASDAAAGQATNARVSKKLRRKNKTNAQPNTPLAFIVVNALKNLTLSDDCRAKQHFRNQGEANAALIAFCTKGLADPNTVVRTYCMYIGSLYKCMDATQSCQIRSL